MANWTVSTQWKKSVEEHEIWTHPKHGTMRRRTGFRWGTFTVETEDGEIPELELVEVPGGDGNVDSVDMYNCGYDVELQSLDDGCWEDYEWPEGMDEAEIERLEGILEEEGFYALEEIDDPWSLDDTECYFWGPIEILNEAGDVVKIINEEIE